MSRAAVRRLLAIGLATFAAASATASATTWCVKDPTCPPSGNASQTTIQGAVNAAATSGDSILIGPGTFIESVNFNNKSIDVTGAGSSQTVIQGQTPGSTTMTAGSGGTIKDLGVELAGTGSRGLFLSGSAVRVAVTAPPGTTSGLGVQLLSSTFDDGSITLPAGPGITTVGAEAFVVPGGAVQDSSITASTGVDSITTVARDRILANLGISDINSGPAGGLDANFVVDDVAIEAVPGPMPETAIDAIGAAPTAGSAELQLTVRHCTLIGDGASGSIGLKVHATAGGGSVADFADMDSSIVRGFATSIDRVATGAGGNAANVLVRDDFSDVTAATESSTNNGVPVGTGSITDGSHNVNVDPGFAAATLGGPNGLHLLASSPLIDAGNPVLGAGESPTDTDGAPRGVAGRVGANPVADIGAFEFQPHAPTVTVSGPPGAVVARAPAAFTAIAADPDPGDSLTLAWHFDDGGAGSGAAVSHSFATPGTHTATVTVTDLEGLTVTASVNVTVLAPPSTPRRPVITSLAIRPRNLLAASSGPATVTAATRATGAIVSYIDSQQATTTFTIGRLIRGVRIGRRCAASKGRPGHRARCTLIIGVGSFTHRDVAGANRFRFTGRVSAHRLLPGSYRLTAVARNGAGSSRPVFARFAVHH